MTAKSAFTNRQLAGQIKYETLLTDWVETTGDFYLGYNRLAAYVHQNVSKEKLNAQQIAYIGQRPKAPVISLLRTMEVELERLLQDMLLSDTLQPVTITEYYQKLAAHTRVLKRLNQQAQTRLLLMTSSKLASTPPSHETR